jgi:hypothetical protein
MSKEEEAEHNRERGRVRLWKGVVFTMAIVLLGLLLLALYCTYLVLWDVMQASFAIVSY